MEPGRVGVVVGDCDCMAPGGSRGDKACLVSTKAAGRHDQIDFPPRVSVATRHALSFGVPIPRPVCIEFDIANETGVRKISIPGGSRKDKACLVSTI